MRRWLPRLRSVPSEPVAKVEPLRTALAFSEVEGALALYVTALSDGALRVSSTGGANGGSYSDGKTIFFPLEVDLFAEPAEARRLYRVSAAWKVLQVRSGALEIAPLLASDDPGRALALYEAIHGEWLDRRLVATWPGLAADLALLRHDALRRRPAPPAGLPSERLLQALLSRPVAAALDTATLAGTGFDSDRLQAALSADDLAASRSLALELAAAHPALDGALPIVHYRGRIRPDLVRNWRPQQPEDEPEPAA